MRSRVWRTALSAAAIAVAAGCRGGSGEAEPPPPVVDAPERRVEARLLLPRSWSWNREDTLRLDVVNGRSEPFEGTAELVVARALETTGSRPAGEPEPAHGGALRTAFPLRLAPGERISLRLGVRTPPARADTSAWFPVSARLVSAEGAEIAALHDTLRIAAGSAVVPGGCGGVTEAAVTRNGIGPVRLGMRAADLRALCPEARDTTWEAEGMRERGLAVRIAGHPALALLVDDRVQRVVVDTPGLSTPAGLGVSVTLHALRARYGRGCAGTGEGRIAVWFPTAPGISWGLDPRAAPLTDPVFDPAALPGDARVERLWVREGNDDCPRPASAPESAEEERNP